MSRDVLGVAFGGSDRKAEGWVGLENAADHQSNTEEGTEPRAPTAARTIGKNPGNADGEDDAQYPSENEVRDLDPAMLAHRKQADGMAADVEAIGCEYLGRDRRDEQWSGDHSTGKHGAGGDVSPALGVDSGAGHDEEAP
jgi:hypothetical protein